jgi:hypothetical protein
MDVNDGSRPGCGYWAAIVLGLSPYLVIALYARSTGDPFYLGPTLCFIVLVAPCSALVLWRQSKRHISKAWSRAALLLAALNAGLFLYFFLPLMWGVWLAERSRPGSTGLAGSLTNGIDRLREY